jgi:dynein heavy chain
MLALQMAVKLKMQEGEIDPDEWSFFLRGGVSMDDNKNAPQKPPGQEWIQQQAWDHLVELDK